MPDTNGAAGSASAGNASPRVFQTLQNSTESSFTAPLDLLADTNSTSQWLTLPSSPRRAAGASSSLLDNHHAMAGSRSITGLLDTLPRNSHRLTEPGFDLLTGGSEVLLHSEGASLPDPANLHKAADAQAHRGDAPHYRHKRPESSPLPPPPPPGKSRPGCPPAPPFNSTLAPITPCSPHSSWLSTSESDTDHSHCGLEPATPSPNPPPQRRSQPASAQTARDRPVKYRLTPKCNIPKLAIPKLSGRSAHGAAASSGSAAATSSQVPIGFGYESLDSPATSIASTASQDSPSASMGSSSTAPAWMSTTPAATPAKEPGILTPRTTSDTAGHSTPRRSTSLAPTEYNSCISSMPISRASSVQLPASRPTSTESERLLSARMLPPEALEPCALPLAECQSGGAAPADQRSESLPPGQWIDSLGDHPSVNRAWSNPFFAVRGAGGADVTGPDMRRSPSTQSALLPATQHGIHRTRQVGVHAGALLTSHPDSENLQNPSNEQSQFDTHSHADDVAETIARGPSMPAATILSILGEINDIEQRISSEWAAEQALRADELASIPSVAEDPAPLRGPRSRVTPDDVVAAARDGMRTARAHRVVAQELPEPPLETSRTLPESPRNWEERAQELEERLVEHQLASARERKEIEAKLVETERQLALSARAASPPLPPQSDLRERDEEGAAREGRAAFEELQATADAVLKIESMVHERLEPLVMHVAGMKRRMLSAQEEAAALRSELACAQRRCVHLQGELQAQAQAQATLSRQAGTSDTAETCSTASRPGLPPASPTRLPPPPQHSGEINTLLRQLQLATAENVELRAVSEAATERERGLQAIVDGRSAGDQYVPHAVHAEVLHQNKVLTAQVLQLRSDLEVLYMDDPWRTNVDTMLEGAATGATGPASAMNTVARLGALLGISENRTILRSSASGMRPSWSLGSTQVDVPEPFSPFHRGGSNTCMPCDEAAPDKRVHRDVVAPITPEAPAYKQRPSTDSTHSASMLGAPSVIECSTDLGVDSAPGAGYLTPSQSMLNALERGSVMHIREQTAERLVSTLQNQAATIVEKDAAIVQLEERVKALEVAAGRRQTGGGALAGSDTGASTTARLSTAAECGGSGDVDSEPCMPQPDLCGNRLAQVIGADRAVMPDWESLPVPNTFKEALEQILMLQVENSRLQDKLAGFPTHTDDGLDPRDAPNPVGSVASSGAVSRPSTVWEKGNSKGKWPPTSKCRPQPSLTKTLTNARKTLASMHTLAEAVSSVQGQHMRGAEAVGDAAGAGEGGATGAIAAASGAVIANGNVANGPELEVEVFKDLVMRELSDQVVAWQQAHGDVSRALVSAKMRLAELQTEHDQLVGLVKSLSCKPNQDREICSPQKASGIPTPSKRLGFFGRLKPPRR